jgi:predicted nucleic acid-binding protein
MSGFLLDTNVVSELRRPVPNRRVARFVAETPLDQLHLSVVTFAEIRFGIEAAPAAARRAELTGWLDSALRPMFEDRALPIDEGVLLRWRLIIADGRARGYTFSHPDVLIAATAAHHGLAVATRNAREFIAAGVAVFDPWTGRRTAARSTAG